MHLFMAQEGSETGNYYNKSTIDCLIKHLIACTKARIKMFSKNLKVFLHYLIEDIWRKK